MKRLGIAIVSGGIIAVSLFALMAQLISVDGKYKKPESDDLSIEFLRVKKDSDAESRQRRLPKKPPPPKSPPKMDNLKVAEMKAPQAPKMAMDMPKLNAPMAGDGPYLGAAGAGMGDGDVMPLVRIEPQYPRKAAMKGVEGWVVLRFDVTAQGAVTNVDILDAKPRRMFNSAAKRALLKWKYKPKSVDGKPVPREGLKVKLDFKLEG